MASVTATLLDLYRTGIDVEFVVDHDYVIDVNVIELHQRTGWAARGVHIGARFGENNFWAAH